MNRDYMANMLFNINDVVETLRFTLLIRKSKKIMMKVNLRVNQKH
ncbi:MAG: hypothetical protein CM15mV13_0220 [uncultured marine virus]|nr:MAG: hypothetical protein CM15mV13_0220 [uncultured marine virus]